MNKKVQHSVFVAALSSLLATPAFSSPTTLPTPTDIPACNIAAIEAHAPVVFPCNAIVGDGQNVDASTTLEGVTIQRRFTHIPSLAVQLNSHRGLSNLKAAGAKRIIPDRIVKAIGKPANSGKPPKDSGGGQTIPAGISRIGAQPGALSLTGSNIGVAVVDTGIDLSHSDLSPGNECFDAFGNDCTDGHGHGTHVAGIIGAAWNNTQDVVGVAPDATPYAVRVLDDTGSGFDTTVMAGLDWVLSNWDQVTPNIQVVNMSLGRDGELNDNAGYHSLVQQLAALNITVVVAAGNSYNKEVSQQVPATYPEAFAIASTTATAGNNAGCRGYSGTIPGDTASFFTTDGMFNPDTHIGVTISAPGANSENIKKSCHISSTGILSLAAGGGTAEMSGTSMASPHVAGVVALMHQANIAQENETMRAMLRATASDIGTIPFDSPTAGYSFDNEREGVASACGVLGECP